MNKIVSKVIELLIFFALWQLIVVAFEPPTYILPSPLKVFSVLLKNNQIIFSNAVITFFEAFSGFLIANLVSLVIALIIVFYGKLEDIIMPIAIVLKTMPVIAIAPLLIIWFGSGALSKIVTAMLVCFFPALVNVLAGARSLDTNLIELFRVYAASRTQLTKFLILPGILPYFFSALKVSSSLAVIGALVGEFIGSNKGLGFLIMSNYYNMNTAFVFATITVSSIIGISFYYVIRFFEKKLILESELIT